MKIHAKEKAIQVVTIQKMYEEVTFTRMVWVFLSAGVIGCVIETIFCLITSGRLMSRAGVIYGPFSQVYGIGAIVLVLLLIPLQALGDGWLFCGGAVIGGVYEAVCSLVQEHWFGSVSWEYSDYPLSLFGGRTNIPYMLFWGILALFYMKYIYPKMIELIDRIPKQSRKLLTNLVVILLSADLLISALAVGRWSERIHGEADSSRVAVWLDNQYPDERLEKIYPNMVFRMEEMSKMK